MTFQEFQQGLQRLGYDLGRGGADGIPGATTDKAIIAFKTKNGLSASTTIGPQTVAKMQLALGAAGKPPLKGSPSVEPTWLIVARRDLGLLEGAGKANNPVLMEKARQLGPKILKLNYTGDDIPWCGMIMASWVKTALGNEPLPTYPLRALDWLKFGTSLTQPCLGAILVFKREGGGHVGIYVGEDATHYHVLGGNQSNRVSIMRIEKARCVGIRWPVSTTTPRGPRVMLTAKGVPVSGNEA